jgi:uncharacterized protein
MVQIRKIKEIASEIGRRFHPEQIVLFGSHARGTATKGSDVDLLVIMNHKRRNIEQAIRIVQEIHYTFPLDLIVRKPGEIRHRIRLNDFFVSDILSEGKTLYEQSRSGMDRKSGRRLLHRTA